MAVHWPLSPTMLTLEPGQVTVFRLDLDLYESRLPGMMALLSTEERARAVRLKRENDRRRFIAAHGQARQILAAHLHRMPEELCFGTNPNGKPYLEDDLLHFNLSHSQSIGLLAVTADIDVGVDVETVRETVDYADIARHFFAPGEIDALFALPPEKQLRAFFACWTRKEAYIKARGLGLSIPLDAFEVSLAPGEAPRLLNQIAAEDWTLFDLKPSAQHVAALAVPAGTREPRLYAWPQP